MEYFLDNFKDVGIISGGSYKYKYKYKYKYRISYIQFIFDQITRKYDLLQ